MPPEEAFEALDDDGDGYIQFPELVAYMAEEGVAAAGVSNMFSIADEDNDGLITFEEFLEVAGDAAAWDAGV